MLLAAFNSIIRPLAFMWYYDSENLTMLTGSESQSEYSEFLAAASGDATITVTCLGYFLNPCERRRRFVKGLLH